MKLELHYTPTDCPAKSSTAFPFSHTLHTMVNPTTRLHLPHMHASLASLEASPRKCFAFNSCIGILGAYRYKNLMNHDMFPTEHKPKPPVTLCFASSGRKLQVITAVNARLGPCRQLRSARRKLQDAGHEMGLSLPWRQGRPLWVFKARWPENEAGLETFEWLQRLANLDMQLTDIETPRNKTSI